MARVCKKNINTSFFHIMVQGNNKEYIFNSVKDINQYMKIMKDTKEKIDITILAYCIMNNHAHILFHEENVKNLIKYMYRVNMLYAKYYNKEHKRVGYVFRDRYKTQPIYSEKHLISCVRYIHNNPVKANICKRPYEYKYSSCYNNIFYTDTELERNIKKNLYVQNESHDLNKDEAFMFMEDGENKEEICKEILKQIMVKNNITLKEFCQNEELLSLAIKKLKYENDISYRMMETILGINRKKLKRIESREL